jgi:hypothetical protein
VAVSRVRLLGVWSARACLLIEAGYVAVFVAGFASVRTTNNPLPDPVGCATSAGRVERFGIFG